MAATGAVCDLETGQFQCRPGWTGEHCHTQCALDCGANGRCSATGALGPQCECGLGWWGDQCDQFDVCDTIQCGAGYMYMYCQANDDDTNTASCVCDVGFGDAHCEQRSGGAVLLSMFGGVGGGQAGAAAFGVLVHVDVIGVASLVKRRVAGGGVLESASGLSAPLATAV